MTSPSFPVSIPRATARRQQFIVARVREWCEERRLWGKFQVRWVDVYRGLAEGGQKGAWRSFMATCEEFRVDMTPIDQAWRTYRKANLANLLDYQARRKLVKAVSSLQAFHISERALTVEREREQMKIEAVKAASELRESVAAQVREETRAMMAEAALVAARRPSPPAPPAAPPPPPPPANLELPVIAEDNGQVDLLRDVRWVYANLPRLVVRDEVGRLKLNIVALKKAPSNGAVSLAEYALRDRDKFFDRFVIKLLPRDTATPAEAAEEAAPSFNPLTEFIKKQESSDGED